METPQLFYVCEALKGCLLCTFPLGSWDQQSLPLNKPQRLLTCHVLQDLDHRDGPPLGSHLWEIYLFLLTDVTYFLFLYFFFFSPQQKIGDYPLVSPGCELYPWLAVSCTANRAQCLAVHPAESAHCSYSAYSPTNHPYIFSKAAFYKINLQLILVQRVILLSQVQDIALVFAELCGSCGSFLQPAVFLLNSSPAL